MKLLVLFLVFYQFFLAQTRALNDGVICTMDAKQCPDGSWVGRTGPNCEFVCPGEKTQIPEICTEEYAPVCGEVKLQCAKNSCSSTLKTFGNRCKLESNPLAKYLYSGECLDKKTETRISFLWEKNISKFDESKKLKVVEEVLAKIEKLHEKIDGSNLKENVLSYIKYLALKTLGKN